MVKTEHILLSDELFQKLGKMVTLRYGIKMTPDKKIMFQARMQKRLQQLELKSFDEYAKLVLFSDHDAKELTVMADFISTNKTEFFRENDHFQFLTDFILPQFMSKSVFIPKLNIWSAGCSNGQEAYTIAICMEEYMRKRHVRFDYSVKATDISVRMLRTAREAVYPELDIRQVPVEIKHRYFLKGKDLNRNNVRVIRELREKIKPIYHNLMDEEYIQEGLYDVIFLRNTLIYFDKETQQRVLTKVLDCLKPSGYLFIGHSESLINMNLPIQSIAPSVYAKK
jgi:chemotaxis protein methyltransferase CheR